MTTTNPFQLYNCDERVPGRRADDLGHLTVTVLDPGTGKIVARRGVQGEIPSRVAVHPDGRRLYIPVQDGELAWSGLETPDRWSAPQVIVVDSHDLRMIATIDTPGRVDTLSFSSDGSRLYIMSEQNFALHTDEEQAAAVGITRDDVRKGLVMEVDTATSLTLRTFRNVSDRSRRREIGRHGMALSTDGTRLCIGGFNPDQTEAGVRILDLATGELGDLVEFSGEGGGPDDFLLLTHPDGTRLYAAHRLAGTLVALDPDTLQILARFEDHPREDDMSHTARAPAEFQLSPDGRHLYTTNSEGRGAQILDAVTLAPVAVLSEDFVSHQLSVTPDNRLAATTTSQDSPFVLLDPHDPDTEPVVLDTEFIVKTVTSAAPTAFSTPIRTRGTATFKHSASSLRQNGTKELLPHTRHAEGERLPDIGGGVVEGHYARDADGAWRPAPWLTGTNKTFLEVADWSSTQTGYVFVYVDSDDITWN